jgi:hypothetical protein
MIITSPYPTDPTCQVCFTAMMVIIVYGVFYTAEFMYQPTEPTGKPIEILSTEFPMRVPSTL